jgi:hypothetical protein
MAALNTLTLCTNTTQRYVIMQRCRSACRSHGIFNVAERLSKSKVAQTRWAMTQALKGNADIQIHKAYAKQVTAQQPDAADRALEGLGELFTITRLCVTRELSRSLTTTNVIESPNFVVRWVSRTVINHRDEKMAMWRVVVSFLEAEKAFRRLRSI